MGSFTACPASDKISFMKAPQKYLYATLLILGSTLVTTISWAKVQYDSNQLMMKNAEQVTEMVRKKIKRAQDIQAKQDIDDDQGVQSEPEAVEELMDGMRIILSRPDQDGTRSNVFARLRRELVDLSALDSVLVSLTQESIQAIKNSSGSLRHQATYVVLLENLMAEIKPEIETQAVFKKIIETIRDADLKISDNLRKQTLLNSMSNLVSPSETAVKIVPRPKDDKKK